MGTHRVRRSRQSPLFRVPFLCSRIMADNRHTIILVQTTANKKSRTFMDFEKVSMAMNGVCTMFEKRMKDITYDIADLYNYVDALADLSAMVYDPKLNAYQPYNKEWVKKKCFAHLKKQAGQ